MSNIKNKQALSYVLALVLIVSLFAGLSVSAYALSGSGTEADPYLISSQTDLEAITDLSKYYKLTQSFSLDSSWTGLGTSSIASASTSSPYETASAVPFSGTLDGNGKTITVARSVSTSGQGGVVNYLTGTVKNLTVAGTVTATGSVDAIGGVVGYNEGTISHVVNTATVLATSAYNVGGVAGFNNGYYDNSGTVPSATTISAVIEYSGNTGAVTGYTKVGGIVGENAATVNYSYNTAEIFGTNSGKSGIGGIAGRNGNNNTARETGYISNCYNQGEIVSGSKTVTSQKGSWVGGIAGFQSSGCSITNCYNTGNLYAYRYAEHMAGNDEGTTSLGYGSKAASGAGNYYPTTVTRMEDADMKLTTFRDTLNTNAGSTVWAQTAGEYPTLVGAGTVSLTIVKASDPTKLTYTVGETFDPTGLVINAVYSDGTITQIANTAHTYTPSTSTQLTANDSSVTVSGTYDGVSYSFTIGITVGSTTSSVDLGGNDGYTTLADAIDAVSDGGTIYVYGATTLTGPLTLNKNVTVKRATNTDGSYAYSGTFFNVTGSGIVTLTTMTIDGEGTGTLFNIANGATLRLRGNIKLEDCVTGVNVASGGALTVNKASISATGNSIINAGTLTIDDYGGTTISGTISNSGTASMNGGTISGFTTTGNGGGLNLTGGTFTMSGGTISGNTAANGGGVYIGSGATFTMNGGTISGNTATAAGAGVYVGGTFELSGSYTVSGSVYLAGGKSLTLKSAVSGSLSVASAVNTENTVVASGSGYNLAATDVSAITVTTANYWDLDSSLNQILIYA